EGPPAAPQPPAPIPWPAGLPVYDHVVIVVEENKDYEQIIDNPAAPYINATLRKEGATFTKLYGEEHNSQGNYFWLFSGSNQTVGFTDAVPNEKTHSPFPFTTPNLGQALTARDLDIEHMFEDATAFLFEARLHVPCGMTRKENKADGRLQLDNNQCLLLDCKSVEAAVNLQDHLDTQFDGYLRKERDAGRQPLGFLVIAPGFTPQSVRLAYQYKARTNWDVALITAEGLRHLAVRWAIAEPQKPFPVRLLNRTGVIDKEGAEVLPSLI
ncbi:MAG: putative acid phosphatase precursor, partial [Gemmataceae bacterium]|nr:putative acid phosphatase precursor [Gemmataceae bacterium]